MNINDTRVKIEVRGRQDHKITHIITDINLHSVQSNNEDSAHAHTIIAELQIGFLVVLIYWPLDLYILMLNF